MLNINIMCLVQGLFASLRVPTLYGFLRVVVANRRFLPLGEAASRIGFPRLSYRFSHRFSTTFHGKRVRDLATAFHDFPRLAHRFLHRLSTTYGREIFIGFHDFPRLFLHRAKKTFSSNRAIASISREKSCKTVAKE